MKRNIDPDAPLTAAQMAVLEGVASGYANKEIADILGISVNTVANHIAAIKYRTRCQKNTELSLVFFYRRYGIPIRDIIFKNVLPIVFIFIICAQIISGDVILRRAGRRSRRQEDEIEFEIMN